MSVLTLSAKLDRSEPSTSWGFRLYGGKDFGQPLTIQRVTPGSLAAKCGVQTGDVITKIGDAPVDVMLHDEAKRFIIQCGNSIELQLQRGGGSFRSGGGGHPAGPAPQASPSSYSPHAPQPPGSYSPHAPGQPMAYQPQDHNRPAQPFSPGGGKVPVAVNNQYNSPLPMYSVDNALESLSTQTQTMSLGPPGGGQPGPTPPWQSGGPLSHGAPKASPTYGGSPHPQASPRHQAAPAAPAAPGTWNPSIPTGPRKMKFYKPGEAKSLTADQSGRMAVCGQCGTQIRGPFVLALDKSFCPNHFICANPYCGANLMHCGFVAEEGSLYCERDYEQYFAPKCNKCGSAIMGDCVNALNQHFHPQCFLCAHCRQPVGAGAFHLEDANVYCEKDWQALFQTKCYGCQFPIEPGDRWVEALGYNWHSECFNCSTCQVNLEGQPFFAKSGKPYCKKHSSSGRF